jgi:hypothetical protein
LTQTNCKNKTNHQNLLKNKRPFSKIFQNNSRLGFFPETLFNNPWNKKTNYPFLKEQAICYSIDNRLDSIPRVGSIDAYRFGDVRRVKSEWQQK